MTKPTLPANSVKALVIMSVLLVATIALTNQAENQPSPISTTVAKTQTETEPVAKPEIKTVKPETVEAVPDTYDYKTFHYKPEIMTPIQSALAICQELPVELPLEATRADRNECMSISGNVYRATGDIIRGSYAAAQFVSTKTGELPSEIGIRAINRFRAAEYREKLDTHNEIVKGRYSMPCNPKKEECD
jgi:hypothetical protein